MAINLPSKFLGILAKLSEGFGVFFKIMFLAKFFEILSKLFSFCIVLLFEDLVCIASGKYFIKSWKQNILF